jgi:hypothetical protein
MDIVDHIGGPPGGTGADVLADLASAGGMAVDLAAG